MKLKYLLITICVIACMSMLLSMQVFADETTLAETIEETSEVTPESSETEATIVIPDTTEPIEDPEETDVSDITDIFENIEYNPNYAEDIAGGWHDLVPNTTTEQIINWLTQKGNEIIYIMQVICQPVVLIVFIVAAFMTLVGGLVKSDAISKGIWAMVICCLCYAAVLYAPIIVQAVISWVSA